MFGTNRNAFGKINFKINFLFLKAKKFIFNQKNPLRTKDLWLDLKKYPQKMSPKTAHLS